MFSSESTLQTNLEVLSDVTVDVKEVTYNLPCTLGEYTDFISSKNHAFNIGSILRGPGNELQENWMYLPAGYHGRRSTIVVTGTDLVRPWGYHLSLRKDKQKHLPQKNLHLASVRD